jgi:hypothetical protein
MESRPVQQQSDFIDRLLKVIDEDPKSIMDFLDNESSKNG